MLAINLAIQCRESPTRTKMKSYFFIEGKRKFRSMNTMFLSCDSQSIVFLIGLLRRHLFGVVLPNANQPLILVVRTCFMTFLLHSIPQQKLSRRFSRSRELHHTFQINDYAFCSFISTFSCIVRMPRSCPLRSVLSISMLPVLRA